MLGCHFQESLSILAAWLLNHTILITMRRFRYRWTFILYFTKAVSFLKCKGQNWHLLPCLVGSLGIQWFVVQVWRIQHAKGKELGVVYMTASSALSAANTRSCTVTSHFTHVGNSKKWFRVKKCITEKGNKNLNQKSGLKIRNKVKICHSSYWFYQLLMKTFL